MGLKDNDPAGTIARCQHTWPMLDLFSIFCNYLKVLLCFSGCVISMEHWSCFRAEG